MRRLLIVLAAVGLAAVLVVGLTQAGSGTDEDGRPESRFSLAEARELDPQASTILGGGTEAVQARLAELRGTPVVVNKWASWCGPCRFEFPFLQEAAERFKGRVAFLGLNSGDNRADAQAFLREIPAPFASFEDPDERIARKLKIAQNYPMTAFYDASGDQVYVHQGGYATAAKLVADIERYALG